MGEICIIVLNFEINLYVVRSVSLGVGSWGREEKEFFRDLKLFFLSYRLGVGLGFFCYRFLL